jgi:hypothetical protein
VQGDAFAAPSGAKAREHARCSHHQPGDGKPPNLCQRQANQGRGQSIVSFNEAGFVGIQRGARLFNQLQQLRAQRSQICGARLGCGLRPLRCNQ